MSPWIYYAIDIVNSIRSLQTILVPVCIIFCIFYMVNTLENGGVCDENVKRIAKWMRIIFIISFLILLFVPSNEAMIRMIIAQYGVDGQEVEEVVSKIIHKWGPFIVR